jgi:hypothetical protein
MCEALGSIPASKKKRQKNKINESSLYSYPENLKQMVTDP